MQGCMCSGGMGGVEWCMLCCGGEVARGQDVYAVGVWGVWNGVCCAVGEATTKPCTTLLTPT